MNTISYHDSPRVSKIPAGGMQASNSQHTIKVNEGRDSKNSAHKTSPALMGRSSDKFNPFPSINEYQTQTHMYLPSQKRV